MSKTDNSQTIDWVAIEREYRDLAVPYRDILERHGITNHGLYYHADKHRWPRRRPRKSPPPRADYELKRLAQALRARLVEEMDAKDDTVLDRCVNLLAKLVQTQERIQAMDLALKRARKELQPTQDREETPRELTREEIGAADREILERYVAQRIEQDPRFRHAGQAEDGA